MNGVQLKGSASSVSEVVITKVAGPEALATWLELPQVVLPSGSAYVPPLRLTERTRLSRTRNPFFKHSEAEFFIAFRNGQPVGRISAQVNSRHLARHKDGQGQFGFFESIDDQSVANALLNHAARWLRERGMRGMTGPFNLSINEECGVLVQGFDNAPTVMMPYSAPWQGKLAEAAGLAPVMDLHAYRMSTQTIPPVIRWLADSAFADSAISIRSFDKRNFDAELAILVDIFNDSWYDNWGFIPFEVSDLHFLFGDLKLFLRSHYGKFVCIDGVPVGFAFAVPNINEIISNYNGRLLPLNWIKLVIALGLERFRTGRLPLLGLRKEYQGSSRGAALFAALVKVSIEDIRAYRLDWIEFSWILASNRPLITFLNAHFGLPSQIYRLYGRTFDDGG